MFYKTPDEKKKQISRKIFHISFEGTFYFYSSNETQISLINHKKLFAVLLDTLLIYSYQKCCFFSFYIFFFLMQKKKVNSRFLRANIILMSRMLMILEMFHWDSNHHFCSNYIYYLFKNVSYSIHAIINKNLKFD